MSDAAMWALAFWLWACGVWTGYSFHRALLARQMSRGYDSLTRMLERGVRPTPEDYMMALDPKTYAKISRRR